MDNFIAMESTARGMGSWRKGQEKYCQRLSRISASRDNRIFSSHHLHANHTVYKLGLINTEFKIIFHPVVCKTISMMEFE